jgi:Arc-like DNA binding domain
MSERAETANAQLKIRMKEPLRAALEAAARQRGVSMNAEMIARLERSFEQDQRIADVFGSAELFGLMRALAAIMTSAATAVVTTSEEEAQDWLADPWRYDLAVRAAVAALEALKPRGEIRAPEIHTPDGYKIPPQFVESAALAFAKDLLAGSPSIQPQIKKLLHRDPGPLAERLRSEEDK